MGSGPLTGPGAARDHELLREDCWRASVRWWVRRGSLASRSAIVLATLKAAPRSAGVRVYLEVAASRRAFPGASSEQKRRTWSSLIVSLVSEGSEGPKRSS